MISGVLSFETALDLVLWREALLVAPDGSAGGMAVVAATEMQIHELFKDSSTSLSIAVYNGSTGHVISGSLDQVELFVQAAKMQGLRCKQLGVSQGSFMLWVFLGVFVTKFFT